jgi:hypothetical protein
METLRPRAVRPGNEWRVILVPRLKKLAIHFDQPSEIEKNGPEVKITQGNMKGEEGPIGYSFVVLF